jgi:hypothetical protein
MVDDGQNEQELWALGTLRCVLITLKTLNAFEVRVIDDGHAIATERGSNRG